MKTQDADTLGGQVSSPPPARSRRKTHRWFAGIGAVIAVSLIVGLSAIVFAQLALHHGGKQQTPPNTGQWEQVLKGYTVASLAAARNNPSVLYACAIQSQNASNSGKPGSYTVFRSTDFGSHWQDIGSSAALGGNCELAVNPGNSNDVYAVGLTSDKSAHDILKHSADGGQTWTTVVPTLHGAGTRSPALWNVQQISIEGNQLFGIQWVTPGPQPVNQDVQPLAGLLQRLVTSADGGQTWTVIDSQFIAQRLGVRNYAVDPSNPSTIYEVLGGLWLPIERSVPTNDLPPAFALSGELYKTTDGGATWHLLRKDLPFGSEVQLASNKPEIVYVGGIAGPLPLTTQPHSANSPANVATYPAYAGLFHLSMSSNGGATWHDIAIPTNSLSVRGWQVTPDGQVYLSPAIAFNGTAGSGSGGVQSTVIASTAVAVTMVPGKKTEFPPATPDSGTGAPSTNTNQVPQQGISPAETVVVPTAPAQSQAIQRYDPTTNKWSEVTNPPTSGILLAVTPTGTTGGAILWFLGLSNANPVLYRYVTA